MRVYGRTVLCAGPSRLMVSLCCPIIFIISISEIRFDRSFSVASDFNIFTDTLVKWLDLSLSSPMASSNTTCPKQACLRGLPKLPTTSLSQGSYELQIILKNIKPQAKNSLHQVSVAGLIFLSFIIYLFPNSYFQYSLFCFQVFPLVSVCCFIGKNYPVIKLFLEHSLHLSVKMGSFMVLIHLSFLKMGRIFKMVFSSRFRVCLSLIFTLFEIHFSNSCPSFYLFKLKCFIFTILLFEYS